MGKGKNEKGIDDSCEDIVDTVAVGVKIPAKCSENASVNQERSGKRSFDGAGVDLERISKKGKEKLGNSDFDVEEKKKRVKGKHRRTVVFRDMKKIESTYTVSFRILRLWDGRLYGGRAEPTISFLACDSEGTRGECIVPDNLVNKWKDVLFEGKVYTAKKISVSESTHSPKLTDKPFHVQFTKKTRVSELDDQFIPGGPVYEFSKLDALPTLQNDPTVLRDIVGYVVDIRPPIVRPYENTEARLAEIFIVDETIYPNAVAITVWEDTYMKFGYLFESFLDTQFILCISGLRYNGFRERYGFKSTPFTRFHHEVDDLDETKELTKLLVMKANVPGILSRLQPSGLYCAREYDDIISIKELHENSRIYPTATKVYIRYIKAKVTYIYTEGPMCYPACVKCLKKVPIDRMNGQPCDGDNCPNTDGKTIDRYRVMITVQDDTGSAKLTLFDDRAKEVLGLSLDTIQEIKKQVDGIQQLQEKLVRSVGKVYKFRVKVTKEGIKFLDYSGYTVMSIEWVPRLFAPAGRIVDIPANTEKTVGEISSASGYTSSSGSSTNGSTDDEDGAMSSFVDDYPGQSSNVA